jgi:glutathione S-transferase
MDKGRMGKGGWTKRDGQRGMDKEGWTKEDGRLGAVRLSCIDYLGDVAWDHFPALKEWYMKIKSRPTFRVFCMQSFPGLPASLWYGALDF